MEFKLAKKLRFSRLGKFLFKIKFIDYILRILFVSRITDKHYAATLLNWKEINRQLNPILKKYHGFLGHGAALSLIRDHKIATSQDLDYDLYNLKNEASFLKDLQKLKFEIHSKGYINQKLVFLTVEKNNVLIDFFIGDVIANTYIVNTICYENAKNHFKFKNNFYHTNKAVCYSRKMSYSPIETRTIDNELVYLPKNYDQYFSDMYGFDWRTPKKHFNWALNPKHNKPIIVYQNIDYYLSQKLYEELYN